MIKIYSTVISPLAKSYKLWAAMSAMLLMGMDAKAQYCPSVATQTADDEIFNVTFGSLNNTSVCGAVAPGPGSLAFKYSNYTTWAPTNYVVGNNYPFSVTGGSAETTATTVLLEPGSIIIRMACLQTRERRSSCRPIPLLRLPEL